MPDSGFTLDQIMGLLIDIYQLGLIRVISDTEPPECKVEKKAVTDPKNNDEQYFKRVFIAALYHEKIEYHLGRISFL